MRYYISLMVSLSVFMVASNAYAVGACDSNLNGAGTTPCCATSNMVGGGVCYVPADTQFQFNIVGFGFETSGGTAVSLGTETVFNAASADSGNVIGSFLAGVALPAGTYVAVLPSIRKSTTVNNSAVTTLDGRTCTAGSATASFFGTNSFPTCATGEPNSITQSCADASDNTLIKMRDNSLGTITYNGVSAINIGFTFNTGNGVACTFAPGAGGQQASKAPGILKVTMALQ